MQHFALSLTEEQAKELRELGQKYQKEIETLHFPISQTVEALQHALKAVLWAQEGFEANFKRAKANPKAREVCLSHHETAIRNLPWSLASNEVPLLAITQSDIDELGTHEPPSSYPLRVLVMVASPEGVNRLDYEAEEQKLLKAFAPLLSKGLVQIHFTEDGSLEDLDRKLTENHFHILHFSGHGGYHKGKGILALENPETGALHRADAAAINEVLIEAQNKGHRPDLVVLSACQSAQGQEAGDLSGVADTLMAAGVPAVAAMAASVFDDCATEFTTRLYEELAKGTALLPAFQQGRLALLEFEKLQYSSRLNGTGHTLGQWLIPQLLLSEAVGPLTDRKATKVVLNFSEAASYITGESGLVDLRVRPENYLFVGRRKEKRAARRAFRKNNWLLLRGQGGVGKTALAEHLAIRMLARTRVNKVFLHSERKAKVTVLLEEITAYLSIEHGYPTLPDDLAKIPEPPARLRYLLQKLGEKCRPLFLFDNIESFQSEGEATFGQWNEDNKDVLELLKTLWESTNFPVLITGRYPILEIKGITELDLNTVPFVDFYRKCLKMRFHALADTLNSDKPLPVSKKESLPLHRFEDVVQLLHRTLGGNYRALEFFDELYENDPTAIGNTLQDLSALEAKLKDTSSKDSPIARMSENLLFEKLLALLTEDEKDTLAVLANYRIPVLPMAVSWQREEADRKQQLKRLADLTLIERQLGIDGKTRYYTMPLVRELLLEIADFSGVSFSPQLAGDYHHFILKNDLEQHLIAEIHEAFEWYFEAGTVDELNKVGNWLSNYYYKKQEFQTALNYGLGTEKIAQEKTNGAIWNRIGLIYQMFGKNKQALDYLKKSLADDILRKDKKGEGTTLNNISQIYDARGDLEKALEYLEKSLNIRKEIRDKKGEGRTLNNISQIYKARGDLEKALEYLEKSLRLSQEVEDKKGEGTTLNNISQIYDARGDLDTALEYLEKSLKIRQEIGDKSGEGATLNNISQIYGARGDLDTALEYLEKSLKISREIGDKVAEGATLNNISQVYDARGDLDKALEYLEKSLKIRQQVGDKSGEATTLNNISQIYDARGDLDKALEYLEKSLRLSQEVGDKSKEGATLNNIGQIYKARGDLNKALEYLEKSLKIRQQIGDKNGEATTLGNLGGLLFDQEKHESALPYILQSYYIFKKIGSPNSKISESYLALISKHLGEERFKQLVAEFKASQTNET